MNEKLRDLPNRVLNVPVEERPALIDSVISVFSDPGGDTNGLSLYSCPIIHV